MCRKLIYSISSILSLSLVLKSTSRADLIGWWRFDEGSGTTASDSSGKGNDASFEGSVAWVEDGKFGKALKFDLSSDYLTVPGSESLDTKVRFYKVVAKATEF